MAVPSGAVFFRNRSGCGKCSRAALPVFFAGTKRSELFRSSLFSLTLHSRCNPAGGKRIIIGMTFSQRKVQDSKACSREENIGKRCRAVSGLGRGRVCRRVEDDILFVQNAVSYGKIFSRCIRRSRLCIPSGFAIPPVTSML